ncbi:MAG: ribonuclease activity regulator RraA [Chloroflexota bacterium]|nr:ribonuclease activity regulator RraA [Chloroflexota bacterium]
MTATDDAHLRERLLGMTTATATAMLNRRGYAQQFMAGAQPTHTSARACGRAVTVRLGPGRPDLVLPEAERNQDALWLAIESLLPGDVLVIDCGGDTRAGTTGDILAARVKRLGGAGIVVDGALRDAAQIRELVGLPCWSRGVHGSGFTPTLVSLDQGRPVRCFGVTVRPGDYILADGDGVVAIPTALADEIATDGLEQELKETFIRGLVEQGVPIAECYPPSAAVLEQYAAWKRHRSSQEAQAS